MTSICKVCKEVLGLDADETTEWVVCEQCQRDMADGRDASVRSRDPYSDDDTRDAVALAVVRCPICDDVWAAVTNSKDHITPCPECLRDYRISRVGSRFRAFDSTGEEVALPAKRHTP